MKEVTLSRRELYKLVWQEPLSAIIGKYQVTYPQLRKILSDLNIPVPENGYWSKIKFGKGVFIKELPEPYVGKQEIILTENVLDDVKTSDTSINSKKDIIDDDLFKVPDKLSKSDILVVNTKEYFDSGQSFYWRHNHRFPEREDVLDIDTTRSTFNRALRIMDTIIKILRGRGHDIGIKYGKTHAIIYEQEIEIKLREKHRVVDEPKKYSWNSRTLEATGILSFLIEPNGYYQKVINDGQDKLESKIKSIIFKLEEFGDYRREEHIKNQEWNRQWEEKQRIEKAVKEKKDKEISDFKTIFQRAFRYHQSEILRNYVSSVEYHLMNYPLKW
jgi:hypothetical protein